MSDAPKNYVKAGELHLRKADTGDSYYSGTVTIKVGKQRVTVPITIYANKRKSPLMPAAPDAFIFTHESQRSTVVEKSDSTDDVCMDDIPF
jgi:hypothetical protein